MSTVQILTAMIAEKELVAHTAEISNPDVVLTRTLDTTLKTVNYRLSNAVGKTSEMLSISLNGSGYPRSFDNKLKALEADMALTAQVYPDMRTLRLYDDNFDIILIADFGGDRLSLSAFTDSSGACKGSLRQAHGLPYERRKL